MERSASGPMLPGNHFGIPHGALFRAGARAAILATNTFNESVQPIVVSDHVAFQQPDRSR
jgi:hypothetical protein